MKYELDLMDARNEQQAKDILATAKLLITLNIDQNTIIQKLMTTYQLSSMDAEHYYELAR